MPCSLRMRHSLERRIDNKSRMSDVRDSCARAAPACESRDVSPTPSRGPTPTPASSALFTIHPPRDNGTFSETVATLILNNERLAYE